MPTEKINYTDPLCVGTDKINKATGQANKSENDAASALARSFSAEQISLLAEAMAQNNQNQLDNNPKADSVERRRRTDFNDTK